VTGWMESPELAITLPVSSPGFEQTSWIAMGMGTIVFTSVTARRLRRADDEDQPRLRSRPRQRMSEWDRFDGEERDFAIVKEASNLVENNDSLAVSTGVRGRTQHQPDENAPMPPAELIAPLATFATPVRPRHRFRSALAAMVSVCGLLAGILCFWQSDVWTGGSTEALASATATATASAPQLTTRPIEQIRPGMRVLAENPELHQPVPDRQIDPNETRLLQLIQNKPDGSAVEIATLVDRTQLWSLALTRLAVEGSSSLKQPPVQADNKDLLNQLLDGHSLDLNLPEFGVNGPATVVSVQPCPDIEPRSGDDRRLVTSTFRHLAANVVELELSGSAAPLGLTANHPFWSEDRQAFVPAGELRPDERLRKADGGGVRVAAVRPVPGRQTVYNFEVDAEHVYYVGADGVLVHNTCVYRQVVGGQTRYVGISDVFGQRVQAHARMGRNVKEIPGLTNLTRRQARAMEQVLIDTFSLNRAGGPLSNQINSISPKNRHLYQNEINWALSMLPGLNL
jgi:hypothetical protein